MKSNLHFQLHTLFNPLSSEWEKTNYSEKRELLEQYVNSLSYTVIMHTLYWEMDMRVREEISDGEISLDPISIVPIFNFILASGLYLNRSFSQESPFPLKNEEVENLIEDLELLKDKRRKKTTTFDLFLVQKINGTRDLFDFPSAKGESTDIPTKRKMLQKVIEAGFTPLEILYSHYLDYNSRDNRQDIVSEAPNSAFALCWNGNKMI